MSPNVKAAAVRFARVVAAGALTAAIVAVPGLLVAVPPAYVIFGQLVVTGVVVALDKLRRAVAQDNGDAEPDVA